MVQLLRDRVLMLSEIHYHLKQAQHRVKMNTDRKRLRPYRQHSVFRRCSHKLSPRFAGPFTIIRKIGEVEYET